MGLVPSTSRGGTVQGALVRFPLPGRGNLQEGVLQCPRFGEVWFSN
jgi:hypothetical protein